MHRSAGSADGGIYIYSKLAQAYVRTVYACFDQPDLKAAFTFHVTAPAHWTVLSNQPAAEAPEPTGDGRVVWRFVPTPRLPTFTTTVAAGDYHVVTASHTTPGGQQIPLELACRAGLAGHLDPAALFEVTRHGLDFYTGLLGTRYPYAKYGQVFVPELSCLASEDAGCVLVSEQLLFRSKVTAAMDELRTDVILHEMAHMWFGDLVTQQWWDDLWLSESFAEFCGHYARARLSRFPDAWSTFSVSEKARGFAQDRLPSTHPVAADAASVSEAMYQRSGGRLVRTRRVDAEVAGARADVPELAGVVQPDLILLNDDDTGYVIVRFDLRSLRTVTEAIGELTDLPARAVCWNTVIDMVRQAELPVPAFVAMLASGMQREPSISILQALLTHTEQILTQLADPQRAAEGKRQLAQVAEQMLRSARPAKGSDRCRPAQRRRLPGRHSRRPAQGSGLATAHRRRPRPRKPDQGRPRLHPAGTGGLACPVRRALLHRTREDLGDTKRSPAGAAQRASLSLSGSIAGTARADR